MSEINELRERLEIAEKKIAVLEETFETLKNMRTSERMNDYINNQKRNLALVDLINSAADNEKIDLSEQRNAVEKVMQERSHIEEQIANAISKSYTESQYDITVKPLSEFPQYYKDISKMKPDDFVNEDRWQDILEKFSKICPSVNRALDGSYAKKGGGFMLIYTQNSFFMQLLRNKENAAKLQEAIKAVTGETYNLLAKCITKADNIGEDKRRL